VSVLLDLVEVVGVAGVVFGLVALIRAERW
jgi:hypothetical protein